MPHCLMMLNDQNDENQNELCSASGSSHQHQQQQQQQHQQQAPTFHFNQSTMHDSIWVQELHDYVNDDEDHEEHPHLQDFLIPRNYTENAAAISSSNKKIMCSWDLKTMAAKNNKENNVSIAVNSDRNSLINDKPKLKRPWPGILHNANCSSRQVCEVTESKRQCVVFDKVTVRDYTMILGDHPYCRMGPPVTLSWDYTEYEPLSINEYEIHHSLRRPLKKMHLTVDRRKELLHNVGSYTMKEINNATKVGPGRRKRKSPWYRFF